MSEKIVKNTYPVTGMSCASCASSIESMLSHAKGVKKVAVNFANQTAWVQYNPTLTNSELLRKAVQSIGYDLVVDSTDSLQDTADKLHAEQLRKIKTQTIGAIALSVPLVIIGMFFMNIPYANYFMLVLSTPVLFGFGLKFFKNAFMQAKHGRASMDTLVSVSTGVAYLFSLCNTFFPQFWYSRGLQPHVYYEASAVVIAFVSLGKWMEEKAKTGTTTAIKKLIGLQSKTVRIINAYGKEEEIEATLVKINDTVVVKPGEKIPVDGVVLQGNSFVDESSISGEPIPVEKVTGSKVYAGTNNQQGLFQFKAEKVGNETVIAQIIKMVQEAQGSKAPVQKLVDKVASIFVPIVIGISLITCIVWMVVGGNNAFSHGLLAAVTVLVIACPCALGLATPTAIMVGIGKGADHNILIKDAESLELGSKVNAIVLDKTGTITEGKPSVQNMVWTTNNNRLTHLQILYSIESASTHPLANAVAEELKKQNLSSLPQSNYENIPGRGILSTVEGKRYGVGNINLLNDKNIPVPSHLSTQTDEWISLSQTVVYFFDEKEILAAVSISDKIKSSSAEAISMLKQQGIEVYMLTGDNRQTARTVAEQVGISQFKAEVLPSEKAFFIKELQSSGKIVAMIGDGINDSQALAQADVSIAMGKGSDIAIDVAKMILLTPDLLAVPKALKLSHQTVQTIRQNLFWAFIYNLVGIPIAAGILYPWGIMLDPMIASAAMALSSVSVVGNSLRLKLIF